MPEGGSGGRGELQREQEYVAMLYGRLDALRARTLEQLDQVRRQGATGTHQARSERDSLHAAYSERLSRLWAVENRLCFGRLDFADGTHHYVGRIGLSNEAHDRLLVDWRAPAAQAFYRATSHAPEGVTRRRHLLGRGRRILGIDDEVLDIAALSGPDRAALTGEGALLSAVSAPRTGRMSDIVATIQSEQDRVIRADLRGVLVVQGGPGTGKTAVALHRAAYLLYTYREQLARRGVLVIGPNKTFLHYIEQVLPSLGETDVLLRTVAQLYPRVDASAAEPPEVAALKGELRMAEVIAAAVRARQAVPTDPVEISIAGRTLTIDPRVVRGARARARRGRRPHNTMRKVFVREIVDHLSSQLARLLGRDELDDADTDDLRREMRSEPAVQKTLDELWPVLTPEQLVGDLFADPATVALAGNALSAEEQRLLHRESGDRWTEADVPLLDEAAELLGEVPEPDHAAEFREQMQEWEHLYAEEVLTIMGGVDGLVDASILAERYREPDRPRTTAERAAADRTWSFGHVIVDEAQELSPMAWRTVMRRSPLRSMTIVGDLTQAGSAAGLRSWADVLDSYAGGRWRLAELTVNYRTPSEVMAVAGDVLARISPSLEVPISVRESGQRPWAMKVPADNVDGALAEVVRQELPAVAAGRVTVIAPDRLARHVAATLTARLPGLVGNSAGSAIESVLERPVAVLTVREAKGLEFDSVIVVEPAQIIDQSSRGLSDLYVAVTRATQRFGAIYIGMLPPVLERLVPVAAPDNAGSQAAPD